MAEEFDVVAEVANLPKLECNRVCADCDAVNPDWASLNLGILLCIKCAGVHRNLGVHISKVRSLHLDTDCWDRDQLDFMLRVGNINSRKRYEATCPCWYLRPTQEQESTIVRENWIRAKYERCDFLADVAQSRAISPMPEIPKEGWIWKANRKGSWQKRYVMLHGRFLYYFKNHDDSYPKGIIDVCELSFKLPSSADVNKRYVFEASNSKRTYPFGAETVVDMLDWVHALRRAAAYYITKQQSESSQDQSLSLPNDSTDVVKLTYQQMGQALRSGFLLKQGGQWKNWKRRFCVVTDTALFYFKKDSPAPSDFPEGGINLKQCYACSAGSKVDKKGSLCLITPGRVYYLVGETEEEYEEWRAVISSVTEKLNPPRFIDFSQMDQPAPIRSSLVTNNDDSD